jgi:hypothetical protein
MTKGFQIRGAARVVGDVVLCCSDETLAKYHGINRFANINVGTSDQGNRIIALQMVFIHGNTITVPIFNTVPDIAN